MRRIDLATIAAEIGVTQIIGQNQNDVGPCRKDGLGGKNRMTYAEETTQAKETTQDRKESVAIHP